MYKPQVSFRRFGPEQNFQPSARCCAMSTSVPILTKTVMSWSPYVVLPCWPLTAFGATQRIEAATQLAGAQCRRKAVQGAKAERPPHSMSRTNDSKAITMADLDPWELRLYGGLRWNFHRPKRCRFCNFGQSRSLKTSWK
jgi:hypothetical protein